MKAEEGVFWGSVGCWIIATIGNILFWGAVIWVAWHFISKWW